MLYSFRVPFWTSISFALSLFLFYIGINIKSVSFFLFYIGINIKYSLQIFLSAQVGPKVEITTGCIVGAGCRLTMAEQLADNTVIYGSKCERRLQRERPPVSWFCNTPRSLVSIVLFLCVIALFVKVSVHLFALGILEMDSLFFFW